MLKAKSSQLSFYGNHIYDRVIPKDHFLKLLNKAVDFSFVNELCRDGYTPDFRRPAYEPEIRCHLRQSPSAPSSSRQAGSPASEVILAPWNSSLSRLSN